jgi:hypothetical protein
MIFGERLKTLFAYRVTPTTARLYPRMGESATWMRKRS